MQLYGKDNQCGYVAKTSVEHLHAKISASIVLLQGLVQVLLHCQHKSQHDFMVRMVDVVMLQRQVLKQLNCQDKSQYSFKDKCQGQHQCIMNTSVKFDVKTQRLRKLCCKTKTSNKKICQGKDLIARMKKRKKNFLKSKKRKLKVEHVPQ